MLFSLRYLRVNPANNFPFSTLLLSFIIAFSINADALSNEPQETQEASYITVGTISLVGNKITQPGIIYREILFRSNDSISSDNWSEFLIQSRQNLLNTSLFNFVEIETSVREGNANIIDITFRFVERWYIWPIPVVELADRNFNEWWESRDFSRLNYGIFLNHNNFRGRRELLQALVLAGYSQAFALNYLKPNLNKAQTLGFGLGFSFSRRHELAYATSNDLLVYFDDPRKYTMRDFIVNGSLFFRPQIHQSHSLLLQFSQFHFTDTIYSLNPDFYINNNTSPRFLSLVYEFRSDHRNLKYYPTSGYYYDLVVSKHGLGILQNSKLNVLNVSSSYKRYLPLHERWYLLTGATAKLSFSSEQPYFMSRSLGYMYDFVRGYEYYVVDGTHAGLLKTNLKYQILKPVVIQLPFIRSEKFSKLHLSLFLGIHSDIGFVYEPGNDNSANQLPNRLLWGNGVGFDVVTYYDRVMRMEYSVNHFGEYGFFVHFLAPI
ncbi:MAG: hypothetical protein IH597_05105 [Bacteroidales bacterium]|nr:hypothetical protein [Bacteroidales bacterium]